MTLAQLRAELATTRKAAAERGLARHAEMDAIEAAVAAHAADGGRHTGNLTKGL